jgi:hypothetical protein
MLNWILLSFKREKRELFLQMVLLLFGLNQNAQVRLDRCIEVALTNKYRIP